VPDVSAHAPATAVPTDGRSLAAYTTLRLGGPPAHLVSAANEEEAVAIVRATDGPLLILAGGSNVVVSDDGAPGTVVLLRSRGLRNTHPGDGSTVLRVAAGEPWDAVVASTVRAGYAGLECLSGIPGSAGATPIQNVGAYGSEVADVITQVRTLDRGTGRVRTFFAVECGFGYRTSRFKHPTAPDDWPARYVVTAVTFQLRLGTLSAPVGYPELARRLGVPVGERAPAADVRAAVLALRASKGMVLAEEDPDTWSAGSFFTNPVLSADDAAALPPEAPRFPQPDGLVKTSAAWLIDAAGFGKGYGRGPARLSEKHSLALTNRGTAKASDVLDLAREVRAGVRAKFGVTLVVEPVLVGCEL
jgi:UDP-N-acetylmuramate dehydrogenase